MKNVMTRIASFFHSKYQFIYLFLAQLGLRIAQRGQSLGTIFFFWTFTPRLAGLAEGILLGSRNQKKNPQSRF